MYDVLDDPLAKASAPDYQPVYQESQPPTDSTPDDFLRHFSYSPAEEGRRICRFCLGGTEVGNDLIHPCNCSGTSAWVHRTCLDQWRIMSTQPHAFTRCTECLQDYEFEQNAPVRATCCQWTKYLSLILLDVFLLIFVWQLLTIIFSFLTWAIDQPPLNRYKFLFFAFFPPSAQDPSNFSYYAVLYIYGFFEFFIFLGIMALCTGLCVCVLKCGKANGHDGATNSYAFNRYSSYRFSFFDYFLCWYLCHFGVCDWGYSGFSGGGCGGCLGCGNCNSTDCDLGDCGGGDCNCDGGGEGGAAILVVLLVIVVILLVVLIIIGLVAGIAIVVLVVAMTVKRRSTIMYRRDQAENFTVRDLSQPTGYVNQGYVQPQADQV